MSFHLHQKGIPDGQFQGIISITVRQVASHAAIANTVGVQIANNSGGVWRPMTNKRSEHETARSVNTGTKNAPPAKAYVQPSRENKKNCSTLAAALSGNWNPI